MLESRDDDAAKRAKFLIISTKRLNKKKKGAGILYG